MLGHDHALTGAVAFAAAAPVIHFMGLSADTGAVRPDGRAYGAVNENSPSGRGSNGLVSMTASVLSGP